MPTTLDRRPLRLRDRRHGRPSRMGERRWRQAGQRGDRRLVTGRTNLSRVRKVARRRLPSKHPKSGQAMTRSRRGNLLIILILGAMCTVSPFSIDMYLPAFPQIAHDLGTTPAEISLSVSGYFIGLALGQLFYGPLLDRFGRKKPLYAGLSLFIVASFGCIAARFARPVHRVSPAAGDGRLRRAGRRRHHGARFLSGRGKRQDPLAA